jgi:hypothetical protein
MTVVLLCGPSLAGTSIAVQRIAAATGAAIELRRAEVRPDPRHRDRRAGERRVASCPAQGGVQRADLRENDDGSATQRGGSRREPGCAAVCAGWRRRGGGRG